MTDTPMTRADRELFERLAPVIGKAIGIAMKPVLERIDARLAAVEAEAVSLRKGLSTATGAGVRRHFTGKVVEDPDHAGCSLLFMDDGSAVAVPDARLNTLADAPMAGRA